MNSVSISNKRKMITIIAILLLVATIVLVLSGCGFSASHAAPQDANPRTESDNIRTLDEPSQSQAKSYDEIAGTDTTGNEKLGDETEEKAEETILPELKMKIDGQELTVIWEDNESVDALLALASESPITVEMSMYGGFEQVGSLGTSLPRNDVQTTTQVGDIVLYSGNQIVVFYGSNSWAYTRLGRIDGLSSSELTDLLGNGAVELILFTE